MGDPKPLTAYQQTYHWRNKNCGPWAQEWIKATLPGLSVQQGPQSAKIVEVINVSGDCDLGQRKGKLLTIYDLEVEASWAGIAEDGTEVKGNVKIPEVSHEAIDGLSDYVYEFRLTGTSTPAAEALLAYLKSAFPPILSDTFNGLRPALLAVHGNADSAASSGTSTPAPAPAAAYTPAPPAPSVAAEPKEDKTKEKGVGSTSTVEVTAQLQASADDIWGLLTDEARIPMWSRSPAKMNLTPGAPFELFGGNVRGKIDQVEKPTRLVQSWQARHPNWPSDHFGTMTIVLKQGSDSTTATFTLEGVPSGQEADIEKALDSFYIRGQVFAQTNGVSIIFILPLLPHTHHPLASHDQEPAETADRVECAAGTGVRVDLSGSRACRARGTVGGVGGDRVFFVPVVWTLNVD